MSFYRPCWVSEGPGVTVALQVLESTVIRQRAEAWKYDINRARLMKIGFDSSSYGQPEAEYDRLLGPPGEPLDTNSPPVRLAG